MLRRYARPRRLVAGLIVLVLIATVFAGGVAVGSAGGAEPAASSESVPLPSWFLPIWDAYGRNPEVTPWFDFASLYAGSTEVGAPRATADMPHGAAVATGPQGPLGQAGSGG